MVPRDVNILPWFAGYAEAINAGKSVRNEDQAAFHRGILRTTDADPRVQFSEDWEIPYIYFGIFDGHAGSGCAVTAANELHQVRNCKQTAAQCENFKILREINFEVSRSAKSAIVAILRAVN